MIQMVCCWKNCLMKTLLTLPIWSKSNERITTNKTRIISRNQQMMRLDSEVTHDLNMKDENELLEKVKSFIADG